MTSQVTTTGRSSTTGDAGNKSKTKIKTKNKTKNNNSSNNNSNNNKGPSSKPDGDELRKMLRGRLQKVTRREPLDPTYKYLLLRGGGSSSSRSSPVIPQKEKLYRKTASNLRDRVDTYLQSGGDDAVGRKRGRYREALKEESMRAAFSLRHGKKHEQESLLVAAVAASLRRRLPGSLVDEGTRRSRIEAMALGLQEKERKKKQKIDNKVLAAAKQKILVAEKAALEKEKEEADSKEKAAALEEKLRQKEKERYEAKEREIEDRERQRTIEKARERERERELSRKKAEEEERTRIQKEKEEELRRQRLAETPQQALHRLYEPIFRSLWDMEFANLHGTNPFRLVIDKNNCADMGVPDYCDIITTPMNLTYIQEKVEAKSYESLELFFGDVELLISNALLYNSDPSNEFHIAAKELKRKYKKLAKKVVQMLQTKS